MPAWWQAGRQGGRYGPCGSIRILVPSPRHLYDASWVFWGVLGVRDWTFVFPCYFGIAWHGIMALGEARGAARLVGVV